MHLRGPVFLTQALLPIIADGGRILNVSTGFTRTTMAGFGLYAAAMAALETLTRFMALELGARQIRVNAIAPGAIATDFGGGRVRDDEQINAFVAGRSRSAASVSLTTSAVWSQQYWAMISAGPTVRSSMCRAACLSDPFRGQSRQPPVRSWPFGPASMLAGGILAEHRGHRGRRRTMATLESAQISRRIGSRLLNFYKRARRPAEAAQHQIYRRKSHCSHVASFGLGGSILLSVTDGSHYRGQNWPEPEPISPKSWARMTPARHQRNGEIAQ